MLGRDTEVENLKGARMAERKEVRDQQPKAVVEICVEDARDVALVRDAGGDRIELCRELWCGGLTPSDEEILTALDTSPKGGVRILVREREEGFALKKEETEELAAIIRRLRGLVDGSPVPVGFVVGSITAESEGEVDVEAAAMFREAAGDLPLVFHRAFDALPAQEEALETLIDLGFDGVLTTGGEKQASIYGLKSLVDQADGRIQIIASGGVREHNVGEVLNQTGAGEVHMRAPIAGSTRTDEAQVRAIMAATH